MTNSLITAAPQRFVLVDDDPITNAINKALIRKVTPEMEVLIFTSVDQALSGIIADGKSTVLFLDINMPQLDGWDFLRAFGNYDALVKAQFSIFLLSSSVDESDRERGIAHPYVQEYLVKPATVQMIRHVLERMTTPVTTCFH